MILLDVTGQLVIVINVNVDGLAGNVCVQEIAIVMDVMKLRVSAMRVRRVSMVKYVDKPAL